MITQWAMTNHIVLHHRGTVYIPRVYDSIYPSLWPTYVMIILIEWRTPDLDPVY